MAQQYSNIVAEAYFKCRAPTHPKSTNGRAHVTYTHLREKFVESAKNWSMEPLRGPVVR
jgi:hypothetical protein